MAGVGNRNECGWTVGKRGPCRNYNRMDKRGYPGIHQREEGKEMLEAKAKTRTDGKVAVNTSFFGSSVDAVSEIVAVAEDVVAKIVRRNYGCEDTETARRSYFASLAEIFEGLARREGR